MNRIDGLRSGALDELSPECPKLLLAGHQPADTEENEVRLKKDGPAVANSHARNDENVSQGVGDVKGEVAADPVVPDAGRPAERLVDTSREGLRLGMRRPEDRDGEVAKSADRAAFDSLNSVLRKVDAEGDVRGRRRADNGGSRHLGDIGRIHRMVVMRVRDEDRGHGLELGCSKRGFDALPIRQNRVPEKLSDRRAAEEAVRHDRRSTVAEHDRRCAKKARRQSIGSGPSQPFRQATKFSDEWPLWDRRASTQ